MKNPLVIGLVGEKGSGKETVAGFIRELVQSMPLSLTLSPRRGNNLNIHKVEHVRFSDLLKETLELWALPSTRENLQDLAIIMDQHFGEGTLASAMYERILGLDADIVILDGVRWDADIELLHRFEKHILLYVTADLKTRFARISQRVEKVGEGKDFKQFMKEEKKLNEINIPRLGKNADFKIENIGTVDELKLKIKQLIPTFKQNF